MENSECEVCQQCSTHYSTIYRVSDEIWVQIAKRNDGGGLLCPVCADARASELGIQLYWEAAIGRYPTATYGTGHPAESHLAYNLDKEV